MLRPRFSWVSALSMLLATALATLVMLKSQGDGFGGHLGFPFAWYYWPDVSIDGRVPGRYSWVGLAADIVIWLSLIMACGLLVERITRRLLARRASKIAA